MQLTYRGLPYTVAPVSVSGIGRQSSYKYRGIAYQLAHGLEALSSSNQVFKYRGSAYQKNGYTVESKTHKNTELILSAI